MATVGKSSTEFVIYCHNLVAKRIHVAARGCFGGPVSQPVINHAVQLDSDVKAALDEEQYKHKQHPGVFSRKMVLPQRLTKAIDILLECYPNKKLSDDAGKLCKYLWSRHLPPEDISVQRHALEIEREIIQKDGLDFDAMSMEERDDAEEKVEKKVLHQLKRSTYHWQPIGYDAYKAFQYMVGRMAHDYTIVHRVLYEISKRAPEFNPSSMFDFGSGVGTNIWAANNVWTDKLSEHYCVDVSADINTLARLLLQDGEEEKDMCYDGVYFRQFMPESYKTQFDLVVSSFSLLELPNRAERLKTLLAMWHKTKHFMVLVENGTNAGFGSLMEARDFILQLSVSDELSDNEHAMLDGHIFAPCPHDLACPQLTKQGKTPCSFDINVQEYPSKKSKGNLSSRFSYLILRKGQRDTQVNSWPRVVRQPVTPSRRVHLHTCSPRGQLEYTCITAKKHGKHLYRCARSCHSGDLLPVTSLTQGGSDSLGGAESLGGSDSLGDTDNTETKWDQFPTKTNNGSNNDDKIQAYGTESVSVDNVDSMKSVS